MVTETHKRPFTGTMAVIALAVLMVLGTALLLDLIHVTRPELVRNLNSADPQIVSESLIVLDNRHDLAGVDRAMELLQSPYGDVWLGAALYLGSFGKSESVPYLIKGFKYTGPPHGPEIVRELIAITGQSFGENYGAWHRWWISRHPDSSFDFDHHLAIGHDTTE